MSCKLSLDFESLQFLFFHPKHNVRRTTLSSFENAIEISCPWLIRAPNNIYTDVKDQSIIWQGGLGPLTPLSWADGVGNGEVETLRGCRDLLGSHVSQE